MEWISVKDKLPIDGHVCLVMGKDTMIYFARHWKRKYKHMDGKGWRDITHFVGTIDPQSNWGKSIQIIYWTYPPSKKFIKSLARKSNNG